MNWLCFLIQPSSQLTTPTDSVTCDKHHARSAVPNSGSHARKGHRFSSPPFNFVNDWKKIWLLLPAVPYLSRGPLMCEAVCEQATLGCFLLPYSLQHPVGEPLCRMPLQGMVFVRAWAKATTSNPLLSLHFFSFFFFFRNQSQRALHTSLQLHWLDPNKI